jgi:hypothetical protein
VVRLPDPEDVSLFILSVGGSLLLVAYMAKEILF